MIEVRIKEAIVRGLRTDWFRIPLSYDLSQRRFLFKDYEYRIANKIYTESSEEFIEQFEKYKIWDRLQQ